MGNRREFLGSALWAAGMLPRMGLVTPGRAAPASDKKVRLAIMGGGFGASFQFHEHPNCEVAAVTDLRADRRQRLRDTYGCDNVYNSLEDLLRAESNLDALAVFSGAPDHYRHARLAMERGLDVISAVPACMTLDEAEKLKEVKERTGKRYMMAETSYYRQQTIYARELHRKQGFGELFYSELEYYHDRGDLDKLVTDTSTRYYNPDGSKSWRWGLAPQHYPTHSLGFLVGVTGERITRVSCLGWGTKHPVLEDNRYGNPFWNECALMQTNQGHMTRCNIFWLVSGHAERAQWFGEKGSLHMSNHGLNPDTWVERSRVLDRSPNAERVDVPRYWETDMLPPKMRHSSGHGGSHTFLSAEFINALIEEREPAIDVYEALAMTVPGIAAHQSALTGGEQLKVPDFG